MSNDNQSRPSFPPRRDEPIHMVVQKGPNYVEHSHNPRPTAKVVSQIIDQIQQPKARPAAQPSAQVLPSAQTPSKEQ